MTFFTFYAIFFISIHTLVKRVTIIHYFKSPHLKISIHTLVKRVTPTSRVIPVLLADFNSHSRKESDKSFNTGYVEAAKISIHTLVKRVTQRFPWCLYRDSISIHTLVKRVTFPFDFVSIRGKISIHTLVKRVTCIISAKTTFCDYFNSHSRKESDFVRSTFDFGSFNFNSHSRKESDLLSMIGLINSFNISIHTLVKRVTIF